MHENYIKPIIEEDINVWTLFEKKDGNIYCMGSIKKDRFIQLDENNKEAIQAAVGYMDGSHSLQDIESILEESHGYKLNMEHLYTWLCKAGLISNPLEEYKVEKQEMDYLSVTLKKVNLKKLYSSFQKFTDKLLTPVTWVCSTLILVGLILMIFNMKEFFTLRNYMLGGSVGLGIVAMLGIFVLSIGIHEFAHAIVGYRYGLKPSQLVLALYVGTPMFYVKMPGIYTIEPKLRLRVWFAGIYCNMSIAAFAGILLQFAEGNVYKFLLLVCTTNISLVAANISPLLPLDGYFMLSTILKRPNLRKGSFKQFKEWALGRENSFHGLYTIYFLVSVGFYATVIGFEIRWIMSVINKGMSRGYTFSQYLYEFRVILLILAVILGKKVIEIISVYLKNRNKVRVHD